LVVESVAALASRPEPLVFLEGNPAFYSKCGFESAIAAGFSPPSVRVPIAAFQVFRLPAYEPWMTGALVYPDVFWENDAVGRRTPQRES